MKKIICFLTVLFISVSASAFVNSSSGDLDLVQIHWKDTILWAEKQAQKYLTSVDLLNLQHAKEGDTLYVASFTKRETIKGRWHKDVQTFIAVKKERGVIRYMEIASDGKPTEESYLGGIIMISVLFLAIFGLCCDYYKQTKKFTR